MSQGRRPRAEGERRVIRRIIAASLQIAAFLTLAGDFRLAAAAPGAPLESELVCRATIGSLMGRDPKLFRVTVTDSDVLLLSYVRRLDNFVWTYRCKIQGDRVIWASEPGRWREGPKDDKVSFEMVADGKQLRIINDRGGRSLTKLFNVDKLR